MLSHHEAWVDLSIKAEERVNYYERLTEEAIIKCINLCRRREQKDTDFRLEIGLLSAHDTTAAAARTQERDLEVQRDKEELAAHNDLVGRLRASMNFYLCLYERAAFQVYMTKFMYCQRRRLFKARSEDPQFYLQNIDYFRNVLKVSDILYRRYDRERQ